MITPNGDIACMEYSRKNHVTSHATLEAKVALKRSKHNDLAYIHPFCHPYVLLMCKIVMQGSKQIPFSFLLIKDSHCVQLSVVSSFGKCHGDIQLLVTITLKIHGVGGK